MKVTFKLQTGMKRLVGAAPAGLLAGLLVALQPLHSAAATLVANETLQQSTDCAALLEHAATRRALQLVRVQLQAQGMKLIAQGCPFVRDATGQMQQVLDVRVLVVDSDVAAQFVRGPLADGEAVDMGDVQLSMPTRMHNMVHAAQEEISPDVIYNREWLSNVMRARGWQAVAGHWWAFIAAAPSNK